MRKTPLEELRQKDIRIRILEDQVEFLMGWVPEISVSVVSEELDAIERKIRFKEYRKTGSLRDWARNHPMLKKKRNGKR
jgi:hypothetical protein